MNRIAKEIFVKKTNQTEFFMNEPMVFDSSDSGQTYDFSNVRIKLKKRPTSAVVIDGARNLTIKGLDLQGNETGDGIQIENGYNIKILGCCLMGFACGVLAEKSHRILLDGNRFSDCTCGIRICCPDVTVRRNDLENGEFGIFAFFAKSEISAVMSQGYNILAAQNTVKNYQCSLYFAGVSNGAVLLNRLECVKASHCTNFYVAENEIENCLSLLGNDYLLVNGNRVSKLIDPENQNVNGDNVTDMNARAKVGVNESLLPHINTEQFVGMPCSDTVLSPTNGEESISDYIRREASEGDTIILPPGVYRWEDEIRLEKLHHKTIYAYGVMRKMTYSHKTSMIFADCTNITMKGMFLSSAYYPHIQGTVVACEGQSYSFLSDPGYLENFDDPNHFSGGAPGGIFRPDETSPCSESYFKARSFDPVTKWNRIDESNFKECKIGYRVAHRNWKGAGGICFLNCSSMAVEDVTVFCSSGFAEFDKNNEIAPRLHRYAVHKGPAPLLDPAGDFRVWEGMDLIHTDIYGRLRGPEPMNSTCDATHSTNARKGMVMISCLLERMNDDGGNINAYYGTPVSFDSETNTLIYTHCKMYFDRTGAKCAPVPFVSDDTLLMYGKNGKLLNEVLIAGDAQQVGEDCYSVQLKKTIVLPEDLNSVVVQNATASGTGFLWDNVMVRDSLSFGVRIQANAGSIRNCTFRNTAKGGLHAVPQYGHWPECGYISDVKIQKNLFERNSNMSGTFADWSDNGLWLPLSIYTGDDLHHSVGHSNAEFCLHKNILIEENVFDSRYTRYAVYLSDVNKLVMKNNRFLPRFGMTDENDGQEPVWIAGGNDIRFYENTFPKASSTLCRITNETVSGISINTCGK